MAQRRHRRIAVVAAALVACCLALSLWVVVRVRDAAASRAVSSVLLEPRQPAAPGVIVMDPLAGRWTFPRAGDGLHPTAAGDAWIARTAAAILLARGVRPAQVASAAPVICDVSVGAGKPVSA